MNDFVLPHHGIVCNDMPPLSQGTTQTSGKDLGAMRIGTVIDASEKRCVMSPRRAPFRFLLMGRHPDKRSS